MAKMVLAGLAAWALYTLLAHSGSPLAAAWLTGSILCLGAIWFGLARA